MSLLAAIRPVSEQFAGQRLGELDEVLLRRQLTPRLRPEWLIEFLKSCRIIGNAIHCGICLPSPCRIGDLGKRVRVRRGNERGKNEGRRNHELQPSKHVADQRVTDAGQNVALSPGCSTFTLVLVFPRARWYSSGVPFSWGIVP